MTEQRKYTAKGFEVEAIELKQYGDFVRAQEWVNSTRGSQVTALFSPAQNAHAIDCLILTSPDGTFDALPGDVVVRGIGDFRAIDSGVFYSLFDPVPVEQAADWDMSPSTYKPFTPSNGGVKSAEATL